MTITIEKGIPLPGIRKRQAKNPYAEVMGQMEVGDSFLCEGEKFHTVQGLLRKGAKAAGIAITTRRESEEIHSGVKVRVWRIASPADPVTVG